MKNVHEHTGATLAFPKKTSLLTQRLSKQVETPVQARKQNVQKQRRELTWLTPCFKQYALFDGILQLQHPNVHSVFTSLRENQYLTATLPHPI